MKIRTCKDCRRPFSPAHPDHRTRSKAQSDWLAAFEAAGIPVYLWRLPTAWAEIERVLA
jgi:hypothetical protein